MDDAMSFEDDITISMEEYGKLVEALRKEKAVATFLDMQLTRAAAEITRLRSKVAPHHRVSVPSGLVVDLPLPEDHWLYEPRKEPSATLKGMQIYRPYVVEAAKYAIKAATDNGKDVDFDPDALIQNLLVGLFGYNDIPSAE
jgi:hypothetical protein